MNKMSFELSSSLIIILSLAQTETNGQPGTLSYSNPSNYIIKNVNFQDKYFIFPRFNHSTYS